MSGENFNLNEIQLSDEAKTSVDKSTISVKKYFLIIIALIILLQSTFILAIATYKLNDEGQENSTPLTTPVTTTSIPDPLGPGPWENSTLSDTILPSEYTLSIRVFPNLNSYEGLIRIVALNTVAFNKYIIMHASDELIIENPNIYIRDGNIQLYVISTMKYAQNDYVIFELDRTLPANTGILIEVSFERLFDKDVGQGFSMKKFIDSDSKTKEIITTSIKEATARSVYPCFDDSRFKIDLSLDIKHPENSFAISSLQRLSETEMILNIAGDKIYKSTFKKATHVTTAMTNWAILPRDFSTNTVLGYYSKIN